MVLKKQNSLGLLNPKSPNCSTTEMMTFETALLHSNYTYDPQVGSYMKEDSKGHLHTYMHIEDDTWNYEKYDENDNVLVSKSFTL